MSGSYLSINTKTTIKVNVVLIIFLVAGGYGISHYLTQHFNELATIEKKVLEDELLHRGVILSQVGAKAIGNIIDEAIDNTAYGIADFLDTEYQEIPGFDPPKYHTKYDSYLDKAAFALQDEFLKDPDVMYAAAVDKNGYVPTHNGKYQLAPTGDKDLDKSGNRTKRIFNDPIGIKAARNTKEGFRQVYTQDTGQLIWDISSPVMVKGKHWGAFRVGLAMETINNANEAFRDKTDATRLTFYKTLIALMVAIAFVSMIAVFMTISMALKPLKRLTAAANLLADGKIETPIIKTSSDELGQLADVLERLRLSIKKSLQKLRRR